MTAISIIIGGIGIMNIYVTITECTREIGLRMAVRIKNKDILKQSLSIPTMGVSFVICAATGMFLAGIQTLKFQTLTPVKTLRYE